MAVQSDIMEAAGPYDRAKALSAFKLGDLTFYWITRASAISVLLILGGIILSLIVGAWPAMKEYGFAFLTTQRWAPSADPPVLGAVGPIYGTLVTTFIAMLIAIPVGLGIAIFLTELCPQWLRRPIGIAIELLAKKARKQLHLLVVENRQWWNDSNRNWIAHRPCGGHARCKSGAGDDCSGKLHESASRCLFHRMLIGIQWRKYGKSSSSAWYICLIRPRGFRLSGIDN